MQHPKHLNPGTNSKDTILVLSACKKEGCATRGTIIHNDLRLVAYQGVSRHMLADHLVAQTVQRTHCPWNPLGAFRISRSVIGVSVILQNMDRGKTTYLAKFIEPIEEGNGSHNTYNAHSTAERPGSVHKPIPCMFVFVGK